MTEDKHSNAVDHYIDESLRRVYQDVLEEDVPERFKKLLDRLKSGEQQGGLGEKAE
ncbi:MAG: NepR family anti-sigma factor [Arenibacterium sp.]